MDSMQINQNYAIKKKKKKHEIMRCMVAIYGVCNDVNSFVAYGVV